MVNRCICFDVPFTQVAALAAKGLSFDQISAQTGCCKGCGMCEPYVRVVVATGRTSLPVLTAQQVQHIMKSAPAKPKNVSP